MKNEEWKELEEKYYKESHRRMNLDIYKTSAQELKEKIKYMVAHKDTISELNLYVPHSEWQHDTIEIKLKDNWRIVQLLIQCLDSFIPYLDEILAIDVEDENAEIPEYEFVKKHFGKPGD